jgi:hypothetical protein
VVDAVSAHQAMLKDIKIADIVVGSRVGQVCFPSRPSKKISDCAFLQ